MAVGPPQVELFTQFVSQWWAGGPRNNESANSDAHCEDDGSSKPGGGGVGGQTCSGVRMLGVCSAAQSEASESQEYGVAGSSSEVVEVPSLDGAMDGEQSSGEGAKPGLSRD